MRNNPARRARIHRMLTLIILATLPCYCAGLVVVWVKPIYQTLSATATVISTNTPTKMRTYTPTAILFPSPIIPPTLAETITLPPSPTRFSTPTLSPTPFRTPTPTASFTPTASQTPSFTPTFTETIIPTPSNTDLPLASPTEP